MTEKFQHIVGAVAKNEPAIIRFFDSVDRYSTECFNSEFLYLQNQVKPSKITVLINSEGGSVIHGMSTYSIIQSCPIPVDCVIEGIAASMGSIIWAAGQNLYMHDYSILMIHNPFCYGEEDANTKAMLDAFREQIAKIYQYRFGLSEDKVKAIMDGEDGVDGTYLNADKAVEANILPQKNIIPTDKTANNIIKGIISKNDDLTFLRKAITNKLLTETVTIQQVDTNKNSKNNITMDEKDVNLVAVSAQLGLKESSMPNVTARISELLNAEKELKEANEAKNALEIKYKGKEQEAKNYKEQYEEANAALKVFQDKEREAKEAEIQAFVQSAIDEMKIDASAKSSWVEAARTNFDIVRSTLDSIQGKQKISEEIANDDTNITNAKAVETVEQEVQAKVSKVVGQKFEFKKLN